MKNILLLVLLIAAYLLVIILARHVFDERLWTNTIMMIPVIMGYIAGVETERRYQKKYPRRNK